MPLVESIISLIQRNGRKNMEKKPWFLCKSGPFFEVYALT